MIRPAHQFTSLLPSQELETCRTVTPHLRADPPTPHPREVGLRKLWGRKTSTCLAQQPPPLDRFLHPPSSRGERGEGREVKVRRQ